MKSEKLEKGAVSKRNKKASRESMVSKTIRENKITKEPMAKKKLLGKDVIAGSTKPTKIAEKKCKVNQKEEGEKMKKKNSKVPNKTLKRKNPKKMHQKDLDAIKQIDSEFYNFLKTNDKKLLEFDLLDSAESDEEEEVDETKLENEKPSDESDGDAEDKYHKPSSALEVASDESDYEENDDTIAEDGSQKVTLNLLRQWQLQLQKPQVSIDIVRKVIQAFSSALASISADEEAKSPAAFKVVGAAAFNGVVQLCVLHLQPAILRVLGLTSHSTLPLHKTKKWVKVRGCLRYYLTDLIRLTEQVSSANILTVLLKHLHQLAGMIGSFSTLSKTILKRLIVLWSTGDETVRVLAFLCILKITRNQQTSMLHHVLKAMYLSYVRNCKFVSPNTLPSINFMRRSLIEMFALDLNVSYQHAFLYIRQLAIHLRNAVILKKKDSFQAVYNWQYINSLRLWSDLLGATVNKPQLQPLIYPLITIATGVIRLIPTAQYFPLRFHCLQALITLSKTTHTFIPVLPLILEVLRSNTFNRKHTGVSMRPLQFTCVLRLNKAQLAENGFRDEVVEQVCGLTLEYLAHESASLAFSDLVVPTIVALKAYLKTCRNANHSRKLKQLVDKIQENSRFIDQDRRKIAFGLNELVQVRAWESRIREKGTPLDVYYANWVKMHETKKRRQAAQTDTINTDYDVPSIKRKATNSDVPIRNENGEVELFPSDSEEENVGLLLNEDDLEEEVPSKMKEDKRKKAKKEKLRRKPATPVSIEEEVDAEETVDIVKDLDLNDW